MLMTTKIKKMLMDEAERTTKKEIALKLGVSGATLTEWTTSRNPIFLRETNARNLCQLLGISYESEISRQIGAINKESSLVNVNGDNHGTAIQNLGGQASQMSRADIIKRITECEASDAEKLAAIRVLTICGLI